MVYWIIAGLGVAAIVIFCLLDRPPKRDKPIPWAHRKCGCCDRLVYIHDPNLCRCHECKTFWCHKCVKNPKATCECGNGNTQESIDDYLENYRHIRRHYDKGLGMWVTFTVPK